MIKHRFPGAVSLLQCRADNADRVKNSPREHNKKPVKKKSVKKAD